MSIYTAHTTDSGASKSEEDLVYKPLTFENELFTARVYKRNYGTPALQRLLKSTKQKTLDKTRPRIFAQENVEDPDDSEAENLTIRATEPTQLWEACEQGNFEVVETFLKSGQDVDLPVLAGNDKLFDLSAIHVAAKSGHVQVVEILLSYGAAIDSATTNGFQPLHVASQNPDRTDVIKFLCSQGADIEAETSHGCTPLYYAALNNCVDNMKALLELGAAHGPQGPSILSLALDRGSLQATRLLLEHGVDPNHPDSAGRTALHRRLKVNTEDPSNHYHLTDAEIVELLLVYGADVDLQDSNGNTPLHCLCDHEEIQMRPEVQIEQRRLQIQLANILLRSMRDINTVNIAGMTALGVSAKRKSINWALSQSLIESGVCLVLRRPGIEMGLVFKGSSTGHPPILNFYLRQGSNMLTKRLVYYPNDGQDRTIRHDMPSTDVLYRLLWDPESLDQAEISWS